MSLDGEDQKTATEPWASGVLPGADSADEGGESDPAETADPAVDPTSGAAAESCDGFDNDGDGLIDEETGGGDCTIVSGDPGELRCLGGELVCTQCEPGSQRSEPCGCDIKTVQLCSDLGFWLPMGACDGCEQPAEPCQLCDPGEQKVFRCDECEEGQDCGSTCTGSVWECKEDCHWEQIGACQTYENQCDSDTFQLEKCGNCGERLLECDGCFWTYGPCLDQGPCIPGETLPAPCIASGCLEGMMSTLVCDEQCSWPDNPGCTGCTVGKVNVDSEDCLSDAACGEEVIQSTCKKGPPIPLCQGAITVFEGSFDIQVVEPCSIECIPGEPIECLLSTGDTGTVATECSDECLPVVPGSPCVGGGGGGVCIPAESSTPCGCGATITTTTSCLEGPIGENGMPTEIIEETLVDDSECPECMPGDIEEIECDTELHL